MSESNLRQLILDVADELKTIPAFLEVTFTNSQHSGIEPKQLKPIVGEYKDVGEDSSIMCISPNDIMSDKISVFTWRVLNRNRTSKKDDKTQIKHLYDLSMLHSFLKKEEEQIYANAQTIYLDDLTRGEALPSNLSDALKTVLVILNDDPIYKEEYEQFVTNMCFAKKKYKSF